MKLQNVIAFRTVQVTVIIATTYAVLLAVLFRRHLTVPSAPTTETPVAGINQTEAWRDLQELSSAYRPWNSARNGEVKTWLVDRIEAVIKHNARDLAIVAQGSPINTQSAADVVLWRDDNINVTVVNDRRQPPLPVYIESQNLLVYVRGVEDEEGAWWEGDYKHKQGVLVNAHYDSVSTGYGATDDGVGVVTILQLISHFTTEGYQPRKGIIFLLNDGEEDGLYGASTFCQHPWSSFPGAFLNLEGAGAGGRAALFRSTDTEITKLYRTANPFATVLTADGFKRGLVRSDTDYTVFTKSLDIRGLDVAFVAPRSRYHTDQDATRETSKDSVWHMLSAAISTTRALTDYDPDWKPLSLSGSDSGVWFDIFGIFFVVTTLHTFTAVSISALVAGPTLLALAIFLLVRSDRWYPFRSSAQVSIEVDGEVTTGKVHCRRGFFRTPITMIVVTLILTGLADLIAVRNSYIMYRSPFLLWALFLSMAALTGWIILKLADCIRSSNFTRWYAILWLYLLTWVALVGTTNEAMSSQLGGGYPLLVLNGTTWLALMLGTIEFVVLPRHAAVIQDEDIEDSIEHDPAQTSEQTPLLSTEADPPQSTFTGIVRPDESRTEALLHADSTDETLDLTSWMWLPQFLILGPVNIVILGQVALFTLTALHQTPADGNPTRTIYQAMTLLALLLVVPALPFMHKLRASSASLLLLVLLCSLIWSALAFPFSRDARLKYYYLQQVDIVQHISNISLTTVEPYLHEIIEQIPSASAEALTCSGPGQGMRPGLSTCSYPADPVHFDSRLVWYNISSVSPTSALFTVGGKHTKSCRVLFDSPVEAIAVQGSTTDIRNPAITTKNATQIRLFSRTLDKDFVVKVDWAKNVTRSGRVGCVWSELDHIPMIKELRLFAPSWSALTKQDDGLVEGWYDWSIPG